MLMETPFFRVRWTLHARSSWLLRSHQDAILYALLCDAARGDATDGPMRIPEGLLLDAPERCRDRYEKGDSFAFGATLIETDAARAMRLLHEISAGLIRARARPAARAGRPGGELRPHRRSGPGREEIPVSG